MKPISIPVNPRSTQIWRRLEIFRGTKQASEGRGIEEKFEASLGGRGGKRGTVHCLIPLCLHPHSPRGFAVTQNFTKRDSTITPATQATTFMKKNASVAFYREIWWSNRETGRFDKKLGDSRQNRESWQVCISDHIKLFIESIQSDDHRHHVTRHQAPTPPPSHLHQCTQRPPSRPCVLVLQRNNSNRECSL